MTSSIPTVKAALVSVLAAALPSTQIIYGPSNSVTTKGPWVATVGRAVGTRSPDAMDFASAKEEYTVELMCSVSLAGTSPQAADGLALANYASAEAAIRADTTLGLPGTVQVTGFGQFELMEQADSDGRHAAVRWSVQVYAQVG